MSTKNAVQEAAEELAAMLHDADIVAEMREGSTANLKQTRLECLATVRFIDAVLADRQRQEVDV